MASFDILPIIPTILLAIIAAYGAILSTLNFIRDRNREKPQLIVEIFLEYDDEYGEVLKVITRNTGWKTVTIGQVIIEEINEPEKKWYEFWFQNCKKSNREYRYFSSLASPGIEILSGKCNEYFMDPEELGTTSGITLENKIIAIVIDQIGNRYKSKPYHQ